MITYTVTVDGARTEWRLNGKLHREDGPAIETASGTKEWRLNGNLHREDGPAVEWSNGYNAWWLNGNLHREDGPATEYADGAKAWWLNGVRLTEAEHARRTSKAKQLTVAQVEKLLGYTVEIVKG